MSGNSEPKRHHFIPMMILRNFAADNGTLYFHRRQMPRGQVEAAAPENLFVEKYLYSTVNPDGSRNPALEKFFSRLETAGAEFLRQMLNATRSGRTPSLDAGAWEFWEMFWYYQAKRAPRTINRIADSEEHTAAVAQIVAEYAKEDADSGVLPALQDSRSFERVMKNSIILAQAAAPNDEVKAAISSRGLVLYRVAQRNKSLVIGEEPIQLARIGGRNSTQLAGRAAFTPVAKDLAIGLSDKPRHVQIVDLDGDQVRRMNVVTAERSQLFAGPSETLVRSLSRNTSFTGGPGEV